MSQKALRTRYINIISKELDVARDLLRREPEELASTENLRSIKNCLRRISEFSEKLETTNKEYLVVVEQKPDNADEIETIVDENCQFMSDVIDVRSNLIDLQEFIEKAKHDTDKKGAFGASSREPEMELVLQFQKQMQEIMYHQETMLKQQQNFFEKQTQAAHVQASKPVPVKLPKLDLVSFSGNRLKWSEFWDSFESAIHKNDKLSDIEKFNYLTSKLTGEAKSAISGLSLSNENYPVAVDILKDRFGDSQTIVNSHYVEMINITPAQNKTRSLRTLLDRLEKHIRSLEALKQDINQDVFVSMITAKLPKDVLLQLEMNKGARTKWTVKTLRDSFSDYVYARERAEQQSACDTKAEQSTDKAETQSYKPMKTTAEALLAELPSNQRTERKSYADICRYCSDKHWSDECRKYKTIDERKQRLKGSCYLCLKSGHNFNECRSKKSCVHCGQFSKHHRSLCPKKFLSKQRETVHVVEEIHVQDHVPETATENVLVSSNEMVLMQTAKTIISDSSGKKEEEIRVLLDSGSQRTYITEATARRLGLKMGETQEITFVTFGSERQKVIQTPTTNLNIKLKDGSYLNIHANVVPTITGSIQRKPVKFKASKDWSFLFRDCALADTIPSENETTTLELLIGNDYYLDIILPQKIEVQKGLYLLGSKLGWILTGRTEVEDSAVESSMLVLTYGLEVNRESCFFTMVDKSVPVKPDLEDFWNLESIGITDKHLPSGDDQALQRFNNTLQFEDGRYQVTWPWKEETPDLPINRELAVGRLKSLVKKLKGNSELMQTYDGIIQQQLQLGVIEKVDTDQSDSVKHYIPHHAVITPGKVRVVYDASAKTAKSNKSLNECLYRGPVMLHDLCGLLLRFRMNKVALVADIEKAFLQLGLQEPDRDATRFVWLKDCKEEHISNDNIQEYRFCRVPFGVISSPFLLGATIDCHLKSFENPTAQKIRNDIYVDNVITGTSSAGVACEMYKDAKRIFQAASMNLRDWASNSTEVMEQIPQRDRDKGEEVKVLGHNWRLKEDTLSLKTARPVKLNPTSTKRQVLKRIASVYDPLGFFSPVVVTGKLFLQALWSKNLDWDENLCVEDIHTWNSVNSDLDDISSCTIPRYIGLEGNVTYKLICFCDASKLAYAATVYLHQSTAETRKSDVIFSKTRLAPSKGCTVPFQDLNCWLFL